MTTRKHYLKPIAYNLSPGPEEYDEITGKVKTRANLCQTCGERKRARFFAPSWTLGTTKGCIACTREWFEAVTSAPLPGMEDASDKWKSNNLHLYYEQHYREAASAADMPAIIHSFTIQELLWKYGNGKNLCAAADRCAFPWVGLKYLLPPGEGGSHSLENVRPACREHVQEGAL